MAKTATATKAKSPPAPKKTRPPITSAPATPGQRWFHELAAVVGEMARALKAKKASREQVSKWGVRVFVVADEMLKSAKGETQ